MKIRSFGGPRSRFGRMKFALKASSALELLGDQGGGGGEGAPPVDASATPTPTPAPSGDPWYSSSLANDDDKTWMQNKGYTDLNSVVAAHRALETKLGAGRFNVPADWNDETQAKAAYKALGLPDAVGDAYKVELPEGADPSFSNTFAEKAHAAGILPHQWKALSGAYLEAEQAAAATQATQMREAANADITALKSSSGWGADFAKNDAIAGEAATKFGIDVTKLAASHGTKQALEILLKLGKATGEDGIEGGGARKLGGMTGAQAGEAKNAFLKDASKVEKLRAGDPTAKEEWNRINAAIAAELDKAGND